MPIEKSITTEKYRLSACLHVCTLYNFIFVTSRKMEKTSFELISCEQVGEMRVDEKMVDELRQNMTTAVYCKTCKKYAFIDLRIEQIYFFPNSGDIFCSFLNATRN